MLRNFSIKPLKTHVTRTCNSKKICNCATLPLEFVMVL